MSTAAVLTIPYGWAPDGPHPRQWRCLAQLWKNESNWDNEAANPTSTAYGVAQFLDSTWDGFGPKTPDATRQMAYGLEYVKSRYRTPCNALGFWQSHHPHWY